MNKIVVSVAFAVILLIGINKIADTIYNVEKPEKSAYQVTSSTTVDSTNTSETNSENLESESIMALFASVSATDGAKVFSKCKACHSIAKDGGNKIGPALWGVIGRNAGAVTDYKYSKAMLAHGKKWSFEEMNGFLIKPKEWVQGTKMSYAGLKDAKDRAAVILYMNENSDNPLPVQ
tara:strand:+ start:5374 stop:5904 length:531 start_codon:yes stop_codon:yes gene_type:complete